MISKAVLEDLEQIMLIIADIIEEMQKIKNYQWNESYPTKEAFEKDIKNNTLYVYKDNSQKIMGFVCVDFHQIVEYSDANWKYNNNALVIHRMAVDVNSRGLGIGKTLMNFAENLAEENSVRIIRSDTYSSNKSMNAMFNKLGYEFSGEIKLMERPLPFNCYEKYLNY